MLNTLVSKVKRRSLKLRHDFNQIIERRGTNCGKWEFMAIQNRNTTQDTLPFWVADMDFSCPESVIEALHDRVDKKIFGYSSEVTSDFYRSVCGWFQHRFDWYVNSSDVFYCNKVVSALGYLINIMSEEGDKVIIQPPVYGPFKKKVLKFKRELLNNNLINNDGYYEIDFDDFEEKAKDPKTKLFILCSPHNPVGRVWKEEELRRLGEICFENNVKIISDEIHHDIVNPNYKHIPIAKLFPDQLDNIVTCTATSKTFNLAGFAYSNIIIHNPEIKKLWREYVEDEIGISLPNPLAIAAVEAAYSGGEEWLDDLNEYIAENLIFVKEYLNKHLPKAKMNIPEATYFAWVDISEYMDEEMRADIATYLVKNAEVLINEGNRFGDNFDETIRINTACPRSLLEEGLRRIVAVLNRVQEGKEATDFTYASPWKEENTLFEQIDKPTFLIFLRYYGCTVCQLDIQNLIANYDKIEKAGAKVMLVLQSDPSLMREQVSKSDIPFEIVCDTKQKIYKQYSVSPALSMEKMASLDAVKKIGEARGKGFTHGKYEGNELQLPALFLIDQDKKVKKVHYAKDISDMPSIDEMIAFLG